MGEKESLMKACVAYFRARPVYRRLFRLIRDKYSGLGHLGGRVTLTGLAPEDRKDLEEFFQKDFSGTKNVTISATLMEHALAKSKFADLTWEDILEEFFEKPLTVKREVEQQRRDDRAAYFDELFRKYAKTEGGRWLKYAVLNRKEGFQALMQQYKENPEQLKQIIEQLMLCIERLPVYHAKDGDIQREMLTVFAAEATGDAHYFDEGTTGERLMIAYLSDAFAMEAQGLTQKTEQKNSLWYAAGILNDDLSNDVLCYGIHAKTRSGACHQGIEGFLTQQEPVRLTLYTLGNLQEVRPKTDGGKVYVMENPSVFSEIVRRHPKTAAICTDGQPRLAVFVLMDLLKAHTVFYYMGDFDPEGLLIAQRLKERYDNRLVLWNYHAGWYDRYVSDVVITDARMRKLRKIHIPELMAVKEAIEREKRAAYQEAMLEAFIDDIDG